ncbi:MAG: hypothetical protein WCC04_22000 [Terriglobales bacterium]
MSAKSDTRPVHILGMAIESNLEIMLWMAALSVICGLLLAQEIHQVVLGHFIGPTRLRMNYWSIFPKVFEAIVAIYFFMFAFRIPKKSVKIASVLMGTNFAVYALLSCFPISLTVGHIVAISGSVVRQIALVIYCMAIVQWFKSVGRRNPQPNFGDGT